MRRYDVAPSPSVLLSTPPRGDQASWREKGRAPRDYHGGSATCWSWAIGPAPNLYDLVQDAPSTLIPRRRGSSWTERVGADGGIVNALARRVRAADAALKARGRGHRRSVPVSFLNPAHERAWGSLCAGLPGVRSISRRTCCRDQGVRAHQHPGRSLRYVGPLLESYPRVREGSRQSRACRAFISWARPGHPRKAAEVVAMRPWRSSRPAAGRGRGALVARHDRPPDLLSLTWAEPPPRRA